MRKSLKPSCARSVPLVALLVAAGCGPGARIGPIRGFPSSVGDLALSVDGRMRPIRTLYDLEARLGYSGPLKGIIRAASARAKLYLSDRSKFRADVTHTVAGDVARFVLNEDKFLLVYWPGKKAFTGETRALLEEKLAGVGLGADHMIVRKLFFPDLEAVSGERAVLVYGEDTYTVEYWTQGRLWPLRAVTVDDWSHAPTRAVFYTEEGRVDADIRWRKFKYLEEYDCVLADEVLVKLPSAGIAFRFTLNEPQYNKRIMSKAYRLRVPPGVEAREIKTEEPGRQEPEEPPRAR